MSPALWYLTVGVLLILVVVFHSWIERLPLSPAMIYLGLGWGFGTAGLVTFDPVERADWLEYASEAGVIISLFSAGLKLRAPLSSPQWRLPLALAFGSMVLTTALFTAAGFYLFGLSLGAAVLLAAVLAPTDPVLASEVQMTNPTDRSRLRFTLTGEAGLNDGTAFPIVLLGLGLLQLHDLGNAGMTWLLRDVIWAVFGGLGIGMLLGAGVTRLVLFLREHRREAVGVDDFIALGLIASSYGLAVALHAYGFLAVFAAGLALRRTERLRSGKQAPLDVKEAAKPADKLATDPADAPGYLAGAVLQFNEQLERMAEMALVLITGAMLATVGISREGLLAAALLLLIVRPLSTAVLSRGLKAGGVETLLIAWFGIRGIGSLYYLFHAIGFGVEPQLADRLVQITLTVLCVSICAHGVSAGPLLKRYHASRRTS